MQEPTLSNLELRKADLWGSFLYYCQVMFPLVTGRDFIISTPTCRESHHITIARALTKVSRGEIKNLLINVQPGSGKSILMCMWVTWMYSRYPKSNFLYVAYSHDLASKHTAFIKRVMSTPVYQHTFGVKLRSDSLAKDHFTTQDGGICRGFSSGGPVTGADAGYMLSGDNKSEFTGSLILDDMSKPDACNSDTMRQGILDNYKETILQRPRGPHVPMICIAQRLHEDDICAHMLSGNDERVWTPIVLPSIDGAGNALCPDVTPLEQLLEKQAKNPYTYAAQYAQNPSPAGGAVFKAHWLPILEEEPEFLQTLITVDTSETSKSYNDATVFSFWGLYKLDGIEEYALHWIDCWEERLEPKDLEQAFRSFWGDCMLHKCKPRTCAIEKKSTGVTLLSILESIRGLNLREVKRTKASGSKTDRFLELQPILASKLVSLPAYKKHTQPCIDQLIKITANDTHRWDDRCHVAGSKIATTRGNVNVEDIRVGDKVITPFGLGLVTNCGCTGERETIERFGLHSTPDHKVFTTNGFTNLDALCDDVKLNRLTFRSLLEWRYKKLLSSIELNTASWGRDAIILLSQKTMWGERVLKDFMWQFGSFIAMRQYRQAMLFIMSMVIVLITVMKTWSVFRARNILSYMLKKEEMLGLTKNSWLTFQELGLSQKPGMQVKRGGLGILATLKKVTIRFLKKAQAYVRSAASILNTENQAALQTPVVYHAIQNGIESTLGASLQTVSCAEMNLPQRNSIRSLKTERHAPLNVSANLELKIIQSSIRKVYSLTVKDYGVYYCNGILVSNCDTLYDACKIALIDKTLYNQEKSDKRQEALNSIAFSTDQRINAIRGSSLWQNHAR